MVRPSSMRKLCPNLDKEDGLETVLEVPIPEEMFNKMGSSATLRWHNLRNLMRAHHRLRPPAAAALNNPSPISPTPNHDQFVLFLKLVCSPLIPSRAAQLHHNVVSKPVRQGSIESSTARYIVQQYLAATGGHAALNGISSMYAVGQMKLDVMRDSDYEIRSSEAGGFVLWQKNPNLWLLELVVSGYKLIAGNDGNSSWSQSSLNVNPSAGPPRPLRRFFQGLDPRSIANLFSDTVCIGEKTINGEACFILKLETSIETLRAQSTANIEIVYHTIWGYFSQRTGLLIQFEDSKLLQMKTALEDDEAVFYETSLVSELEEYRLVDGVNIACGGKTVASMLRYGKTTKKRWRLVETWKIEEVDFNIDGLSVDFFRPPPPRPSVSSKENDEEHDEHAI